MELLEKDLRDLLYEEGRHKWKPFDVRILSECLKWDIMKGIAEGMAYLHGEGYCHGDLKPHNVIVSAWNTENVIVKLIDFYYGDFLEFTYAYCPPEVLVAQAVRRDRARLEEEVDKKKADVYRFGITCSEILTSGVTYDWFEPYRNRPSELRKRVIDGLRPKLPMETRADLKELLERCWHEQPNSRPDFSEICQFFEPQKKPEHNNLQHNEPSRSLLRELCTLL